MYLQVLEVFDISYNTIKDSCTLSLVQILNNLPSICRLVLRACGFTHKLFEQHRVALSEAMQGMMKGRGSVVFGTLVVVFSVMWSELLMTSAISCPLWSSVYECQRVECAFTCPVRTECGMFVMYCMQCCMSLSVVL